MRDRLLPYLHQRHPFSAVFTGEYGYRGMVLLKDVTLRGVLVTDHVWMSCGKRFDPGALSPGEKVCFDARVEKYLKGYLGRNGDGVEGVQEVDLKLAYPSDVRPATRPAKGQATLDY